MMGGAPPRQCVSDEVLETITRGFFETPGAAAPVPVSLMLDVLAELKDLREYVAPPGADLEERVRWHLEQIAAAFVALQQRARG